MRSLASRWHASRSDGSCCKTDSGVRIDTPLFVSVSSDPCWTIGARRGVVPSSEKDKSSPGGVPEQLPRDESEPFPLLARGTGTVPPMKPAVVVLAIVRQPQAHA